MAEVRIREVGPRDGLQAEEPVPVEARVELVRALIDAGLRRIEAVSFVSPKAVPAMANAADVLTQLGPVPDDVTLFALVPNVKGAQLGVDAGIGHFTVTVSASATYNEKNVRMTIDQSVAEVGAIRDAVGGAPVDAVVSCAFGSPYEGDLAPTDVAALGDRLLDAGASSLTYADTTGMATPRRVADLLDATGTRVGLHLHETRSTAMVNAYEALRLGVRDFDTSVGGLGGSPFAAGAGGNLATEDFVHLLDDLGVTSGVDLERLLAVSARLTDIVGHPLPSKVAAAGPRTRLASV